MIPVAHCHAAASEHAVIETDATIEAAHGHAPAAKAAKVAGTKTATMEAAPKTAHMTPAKTAATMEAATKTAHMAPAKTAPTVETPAPAPECKGGTARGHRRAERGRGQQYTEAFHIRSPQESIAHATMANERCSASAVCKGYRGRNTGLAEIVP
jgi:hypothetical protein